MADSSPLSGAERPDLVLERPTASSVRGADCATSRSKTGRRCHPFAGSRSREEGDDMPRIAEEGRLVTGGVDTHAEVHVAAVADQVGRVLGTGQ